MAAAATFRRALIRLCVVVLLIVLGSRASIAQDVPFLGGRVNDTAEMLSFGTINELEMMLQMHEDSTSNQVVVLTIVKLEESTLEEYSMKVVETWKLGQVGKDNGVLLLIVRDDRKLRIEVGDGLEGVLT
ncbi:MAG: TPM domain-containing protein, partial [Proteobacteria bacterium]|nr:TPM domain-containing protein [Pseudomonadota bacterium]